MKYDQNFYMNINDTINNIHYFHWKEIKLAIRSKLLDILLNGEDKALVVKSKKQV